MNYYGVRYAKNCHPSDLFVTYFTSSAYVKEYIKERGLPDIVEIRRVFNGENRVSLAQEWEHKVLKRIRVTLREDYLNKTDGKAISPEHLGSHKGQTKKTNEGLAKLSKTLTGRTKHTHQHLAILSEKRTGQTKDTSETVRKISETLTGRTAEEFPYLAENGKKCGNTIRGRTKESHPHIARQAEKIKGREYAARHWEITNLDTNITVVVKNLSKWCKKENLNYSSVKASQQRNKPHRGYHFKKI
jgi:hypothetical protein